MIQEKTPNDIYTLAKNISKTSGDKKENLLIKFSKILDKALQNRDESIEQATQMAKDNNEEEIKQIIDDEIELSIETLLFTENKIDYESIMFLLPISMSAQKDKVRVPSIEKIETVLKREAASFLNPTTVLKIGTLRLNHKVAKEYTSFDWWDAHRSMVDEDSSDKGSQMMRNNEDLIELEQKNDILYLPIALIKPEHIESEDISPLLDFESPIWDVISEEFSTDDVSFDFMPLGSVNYSIECGETTLEFNNFKSFCDEEIKDQNVEIITTPIKEFDGSICVVVADADDRSFISNYIFETKDELADFWAYISDLANTEHVPLWRHEEPIEMKTLESWVFSEESPDLNKFINESDYINTEEAISSYFGYKNTSKVTVH